MTENKRYYWLRLKDDFFSSKRIKKLRKLGADYLIIYLKMQLKALKTDGYLYITGIEDSIADEIALDIDEDTDKVQLTLSYLQACSLLEIGDDGNILLPYVEALTGSETASAQRVREHRERKKLLQCNTDVTQLKQHCNVEKEIEKDIEKDIEKEIDIEKEKKKENVVKDIVEYLNNKLGTKYRASSDKTKKHINARLNEGFTFEDFKAVIDKKSIEWSNDSKMACYLRPETLFGTKFESYLNQKVVVPKNRIEINQKQREGMVDVVDWNM